MSAMGLYLHIPFCVQKCAYCDFASWANCGHLMESYADRLCREIESLPPLNIRTVYVGGGTPSVFKTALMDRVLTALEKQVHILPGAEMSCEMNPGTVTDDFLCCLRKHGFNRVSMGMQCGQDRLLRMLGRVHDVQAVLDSAEMVHRAGFQNLNLDVMLGLPSQTMQDVKETLDVALSLHPEHISCYGLIVEENTPLERKIAQGEWTLPDVEEERAMYELCRTTLAQHGYEQYEISNFSLPGFACRHNVDVWQRGEYVGIGCAACGFQDGVRTCNPTTLAGYLRGEPREETVVSREDAIFESVMLGLRLTQGIREKDFAAMHGLSFRQAFGNKMDRAIANGLLLCEDGVMKLTRRGMDVQNSVLVDLM